MQHWEDTGLLRGTDGFIVVISVLSYCSTPEPRSWDWYAAVQGAVQTPGREQQLERIEKRQVISGLGICFQSK